MSGKSIVVTSDCKVPASLLLPYRFQSGTCMGSTRLSPSLDIPKYQELVCRNGGTFDFATPSLQD